jgi:hypothetical protein
MAVWNPPLQNANSTLIYPFEHDLDRPAHRKESGRWRARMGHLSHRWRPWWARKRSDGHEAGSLERALDDTFFFLPYVRTMLFPETELCETEIRERVSDPLNEWAEGLGPGGVQRMTLLPEAHPFGTFEISQTVPDGNVSASGQLDWIDCVLFPQRVGFVLLRISQQKATLDSFGLLLYLCRMVHPPNLNFARPVWKATPTSGKEISFTTREICDFLVEGMVKSEPGSGEALKTRFEEELVKGGERPTSYSFTAPGQTYGATMRGFSTCTLPQKEAGWPAQTAKEEELPRRFFETPGEWIAYEWLSGMPVSTPDYRPRPASLRPMLEANRYTRWENWSLLAMREGVATVGECSSRWTSETLLEIFDADYLPLYLLVLYQEMRLSALAGEIQSKQSNPSEKLEQATHFLNEFLVFRNFFWFVQPTSRQQGIELYNLFQRASGVLPLFESIRSELMEIQDFWEATNAKHTERRLRNLQWIGFILGVFGVLAALGSLLSDLGILNKLNAPPLPPQPPMNL